MMYGYARVSTKGQARDGNSLGEQEKRLRENGAEKIFCESYTGTKMERPELDKLMAEIQPGDTLIVTKLDRLARSIKFGAEIIEKLASQNITVNILNLGVMNDTPNGKLMRNIFLAFAEFERDMIVERTQEGKKIARTKPGFKDGRPRILNDELPYYVDLYKNGMISGRDAAEKLGISPSTFSRRVNLQENA